MAKQKTAKISDEYLGQIYAGIAKYPGRYSVVGGDEEEDEFRGRMALIEKLGGRVMQTYTVNKVGFEALQFAVRHLNRGIKFGDLSQLLL